MRRRLSAFPHRFWHWHELTVAFVALVGIGIGIGASIFTVPPAENAVASGSDNVMGWAWADPIGWISLNNANVGSGGGTYGVNVDLTSGVMNGFGWSENAGWICFGNSCAAPSCSGTPPSSVLAYDSLIAKVTPAPLTTVPGIRNAHGWAKVCNEGDLGWISLNCSDLNPSVCGSYAYRVPINPSTWLFQDPTGAGSPGNGSSFAWNGNSDLSGFGYIDFAQAYIQIPSENTEPVCSNSIDDDLDGAADCLDTECSAFPACVEPLMDETLCTDGTADLCCDNKDAGLNDFDDDYDGLANCDDPDCQGVASMCTVAWLKTRFGNVYAQKGIEAIVAPAAQYNATYCLSVTEGLVTGFASQIGCSGSSEALTLPTASSSYRGSLGNIDIAGIRSGRYGQVITIANGNLPESLDGRVYRYTGGGTFTLDAKTFRNGIGSVGRGNGLLFIDGADLRITANLSYEASAVDTYLRNLASLGVIVTKNASTGVGGNITIDPVVTKMVGAYFAETSISTGATPNPLEVFGLFASRLINFQREGGTAAVASETVSFDGRAVANPPPGMQDVGKSLPTSKDAY
ncbi:MAG: hypothetical protein V1745_01830 [Patescibacteria group bacterium]